jgi:signal transduction histidine kinase
LAQVVDASGRVLQSSPGMLGDAEDADEPDTVGSSAPDGAGVPSLAPDLKPGQQAEISVPDEDGDHDHYLAVAVMVEDGVDGSDESSGRGDGDDADADADADVGEAAGAAGEDEGASSDEAQGSTGDRTLIVAGNLDVVDEPVTVVRSLLLLGLPGLLLVAAVVTWRVVGRALAPVEAIRASVDEVSAADLSARVPHPASQDEIARLAGTMNRMLGRLEESQARQRRFVADASHELRSPVTILRQHAEVAQAHPDRASLDDLSDTVLAEALRLQRLIDDLLVLARADEQRLTVRPRPLDLDDMVLDEARRLRTTTALDVDASGVSAGPIDGDADGMRRVVRNVVDNAARHAHGRVALALSDNGGTIVLRVDDDGPGVPVVDRQRVFQRFVRLDDARARDKGGSGLGLAIVAEIVAAHGGAVRFTDAPDLGGARVEITLPART